MKKLLDTIKEALRNISGEYHPALQPVPVPVRTGRGRF